MFAAFTFWGLADSWLFWIGGCACLLLLGLLVIGMFIFMIVSVTRSKKEPPPRRRPDDEG
jgi:hypothetical protein